MGFVDWDGNDCETIIPRFHESFPILPSHRKFPKQGESHAFFNKRHRFKAFKRFAATKVSVHGEDGKVTQGVTHVDYQSAALLTSGWWFNYSHFLLDILPMLKALEDIRFDVLLVSPNRAARELLGFFDIDAEIVMLSEDTSIGVNNLWLVGPNGPPSLKPGWIVHYLRKNMLPESHANSEQKRLWINRNDAPHRHLECSRKIDGLLKERGFDMITASELSVKNQIELFARAEWVSGVHGAGFANVVFCPGGAGLVEFFDPLWVNGCFRILCGHNNMRWDYEIGEAYSSQDPNYSRDVLITSDTIVKKLDQFQP